jgi:hypothetical protein
MSDRGPKNEEMLGDWTNMHKEELHNTDSPSDIIRIINHGRR